MKKKILLHICMGSACHQKGVSEVLSTLKKLIDENKLQNKIELKGAFCLGPCVDGIVMQLGNKQILHISPENIEPRFNEEILPAIRNELDGC